jgi:hypothetical protein
MPTLPNWLIQVLPVLVALLLGPLVTGVIARTEAIVQQRRGPSVVQPPSLPLGYMGDILGGGLILALESASVPILIVGEQRSGLALSAYHHRRRERRR